MTHLRTSPLPGERRDEYAARLIVEANTEHTLEVIDDGSANNLVDYRVLGLDGKAVGAMEVGRNTVPAARMAENAYGKNAAGPRRITGLDRTWLVLCERDATRFNRLLDRLAPLLRELESTGRTKADTFGAYPYGGQHLTVEWRLRELGVVHVSSFDAREGRPEVHVAHSHGYTSGLGAEVAVAEAENWLLSSDADQQGARNKLLDAGMPERHMFVWVDRHNVPASRGLAEPRLPTRSPVLPPEITHLWLAADSGLRGLGGWYWSPTHGWTQLVEVESSVLQALAQFTRE